MKFASYKSQLIGLTIISGVICGYILGVIALVLPKLVMQQYITKEQVSLHVGALLLGCFIASIYTGSLADYLGRKKVILITMLIFIMRIVY